MKYVFIAYMLIHGHPPQLLDQMEVGSFAECVAQMIAHKDIEPEVGQILQMSCVKANLPEPGQRS